jgi:hypothetical protein
MVFTNVAAGPYTSRDAIVVGYWAQPPTDTMTATEVSTVDDSSVWVALRWDAGGPGTMQLRWRDDLGITFG